MSKGEGAIMPIVKCSKSASASLNAKPSTAAASAPAENSTPNRAIHQRLKCPRPLNRTKTAEQILTTAKRPMTSNSDHQDCQTFLASFEPAHSANHKAK